jgi:hypothetical protein
VAAVFDLRGFLNGSLGFDMSTHPRRKNLGGRAGTSPGQLFIGCWGAFEAIQVLSGLKVNGKPALGICPPSTSTRTWIAVFVAYVKRHPEELDEPFAKTANFALGEAFPCNADKKSP